MLLYESSTLWMTQGAAALLFFFSGLVFVDSLYLFEGLSHTFPSENNSVTVGVIGHLTGDQKSQDD